MSLNNTPKAETDKLFFNRLEKVGSESMKILLTELGKVNNFAAHVNPHRDFAITTRQISKQIEVAQEFTDVQETMSYSEHINWINFTAIDLPRPIYINLVRHPIEKVISAYYFLRQPQVFKVYKQHKRFKNVNKEYLDKSFNDCVREAKIDDCIFEGHVRPNFDWRRFAMHFCGNLPVCDQFNSHRATQISKRNIETEYAVVGSWEDTNITLAVFESYIPRFFRGATRIFYGNPDKFRINANAHKVDLDPDIEAKLKVQFYYEIELYNFAKQRLYKQYIAIRKNELLRQLG